MAVDPARGLYALVSEDAAARLTGRRGASGPYAHPSTEPYGPPQPGPEAGDDEP
ncbi:hypothetical protein [Streptomyces sp. NPDC007905]|uniref:hypothetical protein n=1 Tax=Streptomyces sp. NPDC007905 TaxID=3364788 RepID=UPI0036EEAE84